MLTPTGLSSLETACGLVFGTEPVGRLSAPRRAPAPARALVDALVPAVRTPPLVVAFSGGRDSSLVLAAAAAAARREGLAPPVPVTLRFPAAPDSEESAWQERVIAHLGLPDWVRLELPDGLDYVGEVAQRLLLELGPWFPPNAHLVGAMVDHAAGGTVVAGLGGDELFGMWQRRRIADVAARRARPARGDIARLTGVLAPPRIRRVFLRGRTYTPPVPWLRPQAQAELEARLADGQAHTTSRWDRHALFTPWARSLRIASRHLGRIAATVGAEFRAPLVDPAVAGALAAAGGWRGFGGRSATLRAVFSELLPPDVLERRHKATFSGAFFTDTTRRFAREWSGRGLDESVVDPEALRSTWAGPGDYRSAMLLQSAWLHDNGGAGC